MKRAGFTMIELIFVIVILGILAAVAIPKMQGVQEQARAAKAGELVAQLNSVIIPGIWGKAQISQGGYVKDLPAADTVISDYTEVPANFVIDRDMKTAATNCQSTTTTAAANCTVLSDDTNSLYIYMRDGNATDAPRFWYSTQNTTFGAGDFNISKSSF